MITAQKAMNIKTVTKELIINSFDGQTVLLINSNFTSLKKFFIFLKKPTFSLML